MPQPDYEIFFHDVLSTGQHISSFHDTYNDGGILMFHCLYCHHLQDKNNLISKILRKVEHILKDSLDSIPSPSPSVKIQIMGGKVCLRCKGKTLLGVVNKLLKTKSLMPSPSTDGSILGGRALLGYRASK